MGPAGNAEFIRNRTRVKSQRAVRGWKRNCGSLNPTSSWQWVRQRRKLSSARDSESRASVARCCPPSSRQGCSRLFIRRRFFASQMRNRANANTSISLRICAPRYVLLVKNKKRTALIIRRVSTLAFCIPRRMPYEIDRMSRFQSRCGRCSLRSNKNANCAG